MDVLRAAEALRAAKRKRIHIVIATSAAAHEVQAADGAGRGAAGVTVDSVTLARQHADDVEWSAEDGDPQRHRLPVPRACEAAIQRRRHHDQPARHRRLCAARGHGAHVHRGARPRAGHREGRSCPPTTTTTWAWRVANTLAAIRAGARQVECHHQRHRRARRQRLAGRDRDGDPHPPGRHSVHQPHQDHQHAAGVEAARHHHRLRRAAEQGDRRPQRLRARGRHPPGRRAEACRHLRDHDAGERRLGEEQPGAGQALRPRRVPRQAEDAGLRRSATTSSTTRSAASRTWPTARRWCSTRTSSRWWTTR